MNDPSRPTPPNSQPPPYPPYPYPPYQTEEDEINLLDLWRVFMRYKWIVIGITVLATAVSVAVALLMTPVYRAEVLLAPISDEEQSTMSAIAGQFGGLASLAGINLGSSGSSTDQALATLNSRIFLGDFIADKQLMPVLFSDKWDASTKKWKVNDPKSIPSALDAYDLMSKDILNVSTDKKSGLVTLAVEWKDPQQAAAWANELVSRLNNHEKQQAIKEAEQGIAYLKEQLTKTSVVELQQALYNLLEAQTKKVMLANIRDQYAFKVIDPAVAPEKRAKPNRKLIVGLGFIVGLMSGIILAFIVSSIKKQMAESKEDTQAAS